MPEIRLHRNLPTGEKDIEAIAQWCCENDIAVKYNGNNRPSFGYQNSWTTTSNSPRHISSTVSLHFYYITEQQELLLRLRWEN